MAQTLHDKLRETEQERTEQFKYQDKSTLLKKNIANAVEKSIDKYTKRVIYSYAKTNPILYSVISRKTTLTEIISPITAEIKEIERRGGYNIHVTTNPTRGLLHENQYYFNIETLINKYAPIIKGLEGIVDIRRYFADREIIPEEKIPKRSVDFYKKIKEWASPTTMIVHMALMSLVLHMIKPEFDTSDHLKEYFLYIAGTGILSSIPHFFFWYIYSEKKIEACYRNPKLLAKEREGFESEIKYIDNQITLINTKKIKNKISQS